MKKIIFFTSVLLLGSFFIARLVLANDTFTCETDVTKAGIACQSYLDKSWCGGGGTVTSGNSCTTNEPEDTSCSSVTNGVNSWHCGDCACHLTCNSGYTKCGSACTATIAPVSPCSTYDTCNNYCTACVTGYTPCNLTHACIATQTCPAGQTFNGCSNSCEGTISILKLNYDSISSITKATPVTQSDTPSLAINSSGYVGIGTTAPSVKLQVGGVAIDSYSILAEAGITSARRIGNIDTPTENTDAATKAYVDLAAASAGSSVWGGTLDANIWNGTAGAGNVGIGTTNPTYKLDVAGIARIQNASSPVLYLARSGTINSGIGMTSDSLLRFSVGTSGLTTDTRMVVDSAGNVGIGITNPTARTEITEDGTNPGLRLNYGGSNLYATIQGPVNRSLRFALRDNSTDDRFGFFNASSAELFSISQNGRVGIGTTAPNTTLDINGKVNIGTNWSGVTNVFDFVVNSSYGGIGLKRTGINEPFLYLVTDTTGSGFQLRGLDAGGLRFTNNSSATEWMRINSSGNVGIGTATPNDTLSIGNSGTAPAGSLATGHNYTSTYLSTDDYALTNYGVVKSLISAYTGITTPGSGGYLPLTGGTMGGSINMGTWNISGVGTLTTTDLNVTNKLSVVTIDPLYSLNGTNYSTFAASIAGGVKEEYVGKIRLRDKDKASGEYEAVIDFAKVKEGGDLWVWRQTVDFNRDNVEAIATPYGQLASVYYIIDGERLIFRSDRAAEISYRLTGRRLDWREWPTKADDQTTKGWDIKNR